MGAILVLGYVIKRILVKKPEPFVGCAKELREMKLMNGTKGPSNGTAKRANGVGNGVIKKMQ